MQKFTIDIRPKRQATLPQELLEELGLSVGDSLQGYTEHGKLVFIPQKNVALDALDELKNAVTQSGVPESDIQASISDAREKL